jgi:hypothetical protein
LTVATQKDRAPREPGLRAFERQQLEERAVIVLGDAPLLVVVAV